MKLPVVVASLFVASAAYAQAPGDFEEGTGAPGMAPVVAPTPPPPPPVRRWSVGLGFGSMNLAPHTAPDAETQFGVGQLAVRYLATRHLELELAVGGGREQLDNGDEGDREVSQGVLAVRYRFNPGRPWNLWLMAGMGSLAVTRHDATKQERDDANQSTLQFGAGLERRWERFALQLELRAVGVKARDAGDMPVAGTVDTKPIDPNGMVPPPAPPEPTNPDDGMAGGQIVFSGNYYF